MAEKLERAGTVEVEVEEKKGLAAFLCCKGCDAPIKHKRMRKS